MPSETTFQPDLADRTDLASQILRLIGHDPGHPQVTAETFRKCTRDQLLDLARRLGLPGVSKLTKELRAGRVQSAFEDLAHRDVAPAGGPGNAPVVGNGNGNGGDETALSFHKFDLGPGGEERPVPRDIPWGYSHDRVTAMVVDPERLYAYW